MRKLKYRRRIVIRLEQDLFDKLQGGSISERVRTLLENALSESERIKELEQEVERLEIQLARRRISEELENKILGGLDRGLAVSEVAEENDVNVSLIYSYMKRNRITKYRRRRRTPRLPRQEYPR